MTEFYLVYSTIPDKESAKNIAQTVVAERLAACANVLGSIESFFWWEGKVDNAQEIAVIFKTHRNCLERLKDRIISLHPYNCPAVVALPIGMGHTPFLNWIRQETHV